MRSLSRILILALIILNACSGGSSNPDDTVARVYDEYLSLSSMQGIVPSGIHGDDSINVIRDYIDNWVQQELILRHAESNLKKSQKDFTKQLEDYRNSLIIYSYERELIRQKLDTLVSDGEVAVYYNQHQSDFELKDNIVKVLYVKLRKNGPVAQFRPLIKSDKPADTRKLMDLSSKYAANSFLDENSWLLFNDILKEIPIKTYNQEEYLKNNRYIEIQDSSYYYLLNIKGFMIKESVSPLSFEKQNIRSIIINKRKLDMIEAMKKDLYKDALKDGEIGVFIK